MRSTGKTSSSDILWAPPADVREHSRIGHYLRWLEEHRGLMFASYHDLWEWSVTDLDVFWTTIWEYFDVGPPVVPSSTPAPALPARAMPGARWFPTARLNYAAWLFDNGKPCGREANAAKLLAADAGFEAADAALQTLGGFGYAKEYHLERLWREVRLYKIAPISQQMVLNYLSEHVLGLPKSY